jgi:hypothetical protein
MTRAQFLLTLLSPLLLFKRKPSNEWLSVCVDDVDRVYIDNKYEAGFSAIYNNKIWRKMDSLYIYRGSKYPTVNWIPVFSSLEQNRMLLIRLRKSMTDRRAQIITNVKISPSKANLWNKSLIH